MTSAAELVKYTNGQCHSWVDFMHQVLSAQGLATVNGQQTLAIAVLGVPLEETVLAVKNWEKNGSDPWFPIRFDAGMTGDNVIGSLPEGHAQDIAGVSGQGNSPNPPSKFSNHWILKIFSSFYDPSYGIGPFDNEYEYEHAALEGTIRLNGFLRKLPDNEVVNEYVPVLPQGRVWRR